MGIFHNSGSSNHTCPTHDLNENATEAIFGAMKFYEFDKILAGSCSAFAILVIFGLMFMHATHFSKPNEQIKIMKIATLIPSYSILSFLSIYFPRADVYISPWLDAIEAFALGSFFLLMCEFISESSAERDVFFAALVVKDKKSPNGQGNGLAWYRRRWLLIFQFPVVSILVAVLTDITEAAGVYCQYESKPYFAKLWITLIKNVSLVLAVLAVLKFYVTLKHELAGHKPLAKLASFKLIIFITFLLSIIFWILTDVKVLNPTSKLTYADQNIGIPNLIICILMVPLSIFFHYAYSYRPYMLSHLASASTLQQQPLHYQGGFLGMKAWAKAMNPADTFRAIIFAFKMNSEHQTIPQQNIDGNTEYYHLSGQGDPARPSFVANQTDPANQEQYSAEPGYQGRGHRGHRGHRGRRNR